MPCIFSPIYLLITPRENSPVPRLKSPRKKALGSRKKDQGLVASRRRQTARARTHKRQTWRDNETRSVSSPCTGCDDYPCRYTAGRSLRRCRLDRSWKRLSRHESFSICRVTPSNGRRAPWLDADCAWWSCARSKVDDLGSSLSIEAPVMAFGLCSCK